MSTLEETIRKYADIINLECPISEESIRKHPRMPLKDRANIFSPFAALRGHDESLHNEDKKLLRAKRRSLSEGEIEKISDALLQVHKGSEVTINYFRPGLGEKDLGDNLTETGSVTAIDTIARVIYLDGDPIPFGDIYDISGKEIVSIEEYLGLSELESEFD